MVSKSLNFFDRFKTCPETVDTAIAIAVLSQSNEREEVRRILRECDLARQWSKELLSEQRSTKLSQYIEEICVKAINHLEKKQIDWER